LSAAEAFDRVGMPEGRYHLGMAALYLATAPKSNSVFAFFDALRAVEKEREGEVPNHLRDASRDKEGFGHGAGYLYPHAYRDHWIAQQYLPDSLQGKVFYEPGRLGYERTVADQVQRRREAQLAAAVDPDMAGAPPEILTFSPSDRALDRWLARTISGVGERLAEIREWIFSDVKCERHSIVLDLRADTGLLTWEALRRTPEGGVFSITADATAAETLAEQAGHCPELSKPHILAGAITDPGALLKRAGHGDVRFDLIVGRNALTRVADKPAALQAIVALLAVGGTVSLAEAIPKHTQRLYQLVDLTRLDGDVSDRLIAAEEDIYADADDPMVNWDAADLEEWLRQAGLTSGAVEVRTQTIVHGFTPELIESWFPPRAAGERPSYAQRLSSRLAPEEVARVKALYQSSLPGKTLPWSSTVARLRGSAEG